MCTDGVWERCGVGGGGRDGGEWLYCIVLYYEALY